MEISDKIAIFALMAAFGSLIVALLSLRVSLKTYRLAEQEHKDKSFGIKGYLIDCFSFSVNKKRYCEFALSITNLSSATKSFSKIELQVEYTLENGECGKAIIQPVENIYPPNISSDYKKMNAPINIPPKESVSGWITFPKPGSDGLLIDVNEYKVVGVSNDQSINIAKAYLLRFMEDEKD